MRLLADYTLNGPGFEVFFDTLNDPEQEEIVSYEEQISSHITQIEKSINEGVFYDKLQALIDVLNIFNNSFPTFPVQRLEEILLIIKIINFIEIEVSGSGSVFDFTINVDETLFCFEPLPILLSHINFLYYDSLDLENSVVVLDLTNLADLNAFIDSGQMPIDILFALLTKLGQGVVAVAPSINVLIRSDQLGNTNSIFACVALHLVKSGKLVHSPSNYSSLPTVNVNRKILSNKKYQQFNDSLQILSEYNAQQDILDKYLRIYHLIENFMFKLPVVTLERAHQNTPFSIRDFRLLYSRIDKSEISVLKNLIADVMKLEYIPGTTFLSAVFVAWQAIHLTLVTDLAKINKLFELLNVTNSKGEAVRYESITQNEFPATFAKLIYGFRNSLVHNRETEFHLIHQTLQAHTTIGDTAKIILEKFVLPWLEEISFYLIIEDNDLVWYRNPALTLFSE